MDRHTSRQGLRDRWYQEGWYGSASLADVMSQSANAHPEATLEYHSIGGESTVLSFAELCQGGEQVAQGLLRLGLTQGDALLVQAPNCIEGAQLAYAAFRIGLTVVPVIHIYGPTELEFIAKDCGAKCAVLASNYRSYDWAERASRIGAVPTVEHIVELGETEQVGDTRWAELVSPGPSEPLRPVDADDRCLISYTSGTTAAPKGVQHTHNTLLSEMKASLRAFTRPTEAVYLQAQPAGHVAGYMGVISAVCNGVQSTHVLDAWDPHLAARLIQKWDIGSTTGPVYYLTTLLDAAEEFGYQLDSLRSYMTGGERVPRSLVERGDRAGVGVFRCYGSTEHPSVSSSLPTDSLEMRATTDGRVLPGNVVQIVDKDGQGVPRGADGEVITIGPEQFIGYTNEPLNDESFRDDGWFKTGDIGRLSPDGVLTITDRIKDIIIRGGENISSREVEQILLRHPSVKDVAVVGLRDPRYGERSCAVVMLRAGATLDLAAIRQHFEGAGVARQKTPEWLEIVDDFPRTAVGKVRKDVLRREIKPPPAWSDGGTGA
jgi:acyl-CoA synthetase (AMP-forming)/AMP-acid ligase II